MVFGHLLIWLKRILIKNLLLNHLLVIKNKEDHLPSLHHLHLHLLFYPKVCFFFFFFSWRFCVDITERNGRMIGAFKPFKWICQITHWWVSDIVIPITSTPVITVKDLNISLNKTFFMLYISSLYSSPFPLLLLLNTHWLI